TAFGPSPTAAIWHRSRAPGPHAAICRSRGGLTRIAPAGHAHWSTRSRQVRPWAGVSGTGNAYGRGPQTPEASWREEMSELVPVPSDAAARALIDAETYKQMYQRSIDDPDGFWGEHGQRIDWIKPFTRVKNTRFDYPNVSIKWFEDGELNVCANCVDRHL